MRVVFFGTPEWAVPSLEALASSPHTPVLVVTQPSRRRGRGLALSASPVGAAAVRLGLPVIEPPSVKTDAFRSGLEARSPEIFVVVAYGKIFPADLLAVPAAGSVNLHFSLLPRYRGAAPVQWAIAQGETETGVTTMRMVEALDAGPIYLQERVAVSPGAHAPQLGKRLAAIGAALLVATLDGIAAGSLRARDQEAALATYARILKPEDGWVDWSDTAEAIARRVRGFDPWPGQASMSRKGKVKILEARVASLRADAGTAPGTILGEQDGAVRIACGGADVLEALVVQPEGKRAMTGSESLRGRHLAPGERLGGPGAGRS